MLLILVQLVKDYYSSLAQPPYPGPYAGGVGGGSIEPPAPFEILHTHECVYVGHTHLIENNIHFRQKEPPVSKAWYGPAQCVHVA